MSFSTFTLLHRSASPEWTTVHPFRPDHSYRNPQPPVGGQIQSHQYPGYLQLPEETGHDPMDGADGRLILTLLGIIWNWRCCRATGRPTGPGSSGDSVAFRRA